MQDNTRKDKIAHSSNPISRKKFLRNVALLSAASQIPWYVACDALGTREPIKDLNFRQSVLDILFPSEPDSPGALDCYADKYIEWVLQDSEIDPGENEFVIKGFDKLNAYANQELGKDFVKLPREQQEDLIATYIKGSGKTFCSRLLTLIFEAMFTHPAYGGNPDEIAWKWLDHDPGRPEPKPELMYPQILKTIRED